MASNWISSTIVLGSGSYGVVYLGLPKSPSLDPIAIKVALHDHSSSLLKEERILQNFVGVPEIVQCYGHEIAFENDQKLFKLYLEYANGGTLEDLISYVGKFSDHYVRLYLRMILNGLSSIHECGFVHCDLKPANILVFVGDEGDVQLKISDFGLSKGPGEEDEEKLKIFTSTFRGTPTHTSSKSLGFDEIEASLDIWSLGCIMVDMTTGNQDCSSDENLMSKLTELVELPEIPEQLSKNAKDFLRKCFELDPKKRWTAEMLLEHPYMTESMISGLWNKVKKWWV